MVIRETSSCSVGPTASDSMLKPRRLNRPAIRASTPGLFSTSTERVCLLIAAAPALRERRRRGSRAVGATNVVAWSQVVLIELGREVSRVLDLVVAGAGGDHRPDHGVAVHAEVDDDGDVVDLHRLGDGCVDVLGAVAG